MRLRIRTRCGVALLISSFALVVACGARGPLDDDGPLDASSQTDSSMDGPLTIADAAPEAEPIRDGGGDAESEGGSIVECGSCVIGSCGSSILMCVETSGCLQTLQCVATTCLTSGTPDLSCIVTCASGDISGALQIAQVFQCVTGTCGSDCGSVLGTLLGGLGGLP